MRFLEKFTPQKKEIEIIIALLNDNYQNDTLIVDSLSDEVVTAYQRFVVGFTIENSDVKMIICYGSNYANEYNFILTAQHFIVHAENIYPLSLFQYPDGTISNNLFTDTHNYLNRFFNEKNE